MNFEHYLHFKWPLLSLTYLCFRWTLNIICTLRDPYSYLHICISFLPSNLAQYFCMPILRFSSYRRFITNVHSQIIGSKRTHLSCLAYQFSICLHHAWTFCFYVICRNRHRFGFSLTSLALSKPNNLRLNRFRSFQNQAKLVWTTRISLNWFRN